MTRIGFAYNQKPDRIVGIGSGYNHGTRDQSSLSTGADDEFAEWDSPQTIAAVERALEPLGEIIRLEATEEFPRLLAAARPDIVFNMAEGLRGPNRESHVPAICEFYGIPYSGSDPLTLSLCLDKARAKEVLSARGVPTARFGVVRTLDDMTRAAGSLAFPLFAKPIHEGSSKGIFASNFCATPAELIERVNFLLSRYEQPVLIEEFLPGAEFTCGVIGNGPTAHVLPIVAISFSSLPDGAVPVYGFEAKWVWDTPDRPLDIFECPAAVAPEVTAEVERVTLGAYHALCCRDWSRIDVRLDADGRANVIEVNPLPGILPDPEDNSCLPKAARVAGMSYDELIQGCLLAAAERCSVRIEGASRLSPAA